MPQDAFTLRLAAKELNETLRGGRVNKINQPSRDEVSLLIYTGKATVKLILSANASDCGVYFSRDERENPLVAPGFCMLLRKYLQSAELLGVEMPVFERILVFRFRCVSDFSERERLLYAEIMGKYSNLFLVEDGLLLGALKVTSLDMNCKRVILPGTRYTPPAVQDKADPSDLSALSAALRDVEGDPRALFLRVRGIAPSTAEQIALTYRGGDLAAHVHAFIFSDEISPGVLERDGRVVDFFARAFPSPSSLSPLRPFSSLLDAETYFYAKRRERGTVESARRKLDSLLRTDIKKSEKRLAQILEKQLACRDAELDRVRGELITANLYRLFRGARFCELENYYDEEGGTMKIALDPQKSPSENAQAYFKKYRKEKRTLEALAPQEVSVRAELDYLRSLTAAVAVAENADDLASLSAEMAEAGLLPVPKEKERRTRPEVPFRTYECEGIRVYAGRNNLQNDRLLRRSAPDDIWLHVQKRHSCHVVIKSDGRPVPDSVLQFAANICAKYSDANGDKVPVDFCPVKFVKKPPKSKAGFVTYSEFKTLLGDPAKA